MNAHEKFESFFRRISLRDDPVYIIDRPCGFGKTTAMIASFEADRKYLVVTPLLSEVDRIIGNAKVPFDQPDDTGEYRTKRESLRDLLSSGKNVVTTHRLYTEITSLAAEGFLDGYDIIIDEVPDVCAQVEGLNGGSFKKFYLETGYATVAENGGVGVTEKWLEEAESVNDTLKERHFRLACAGMLYLVEDVFFMWALPQILLRSGRSFTVYTFMAKGSMLLAYLDCLGIEYVHDEDKAENERFRQKARELITIEGIPALNKVRLSFTGQKNGKAVGRRVSSALYNLRRSDLRDNLDGVMVTCAKRNWYLNGLDDDQVKKGSKSKPGPFASGSRLFDGVDWLANTTRGTNDYIEKSHLIYLYDQHINPYINRWLGIGKHGVEQDEYALTELIQWVYRSRVRRGEKITLYLPDFRMRSILEGYLSGSDTKGIKDRLRLSTGR
ncbi:hypothetical protein FJW04_09565 [Mesorhizobium sp. B2-7-3]|uniref:hypothetical protein n=1 Tax=Mesorhizobium sp. B2-7-3 TaxID=2589907 RepID=UPI00112EC65A|nr:hypothetical protein [Mesorhizobium sp. B2-7-3]TPJ17781.1 hypothetical protein FJW04_09565 [Mesorhizobium sp. B2-7-3]